MCVYTSDRLADHRDAGIIAAMRESGIRFSRYLGSGVSSVCYATSSPETVTLFGYVKSDYHKLRLLTRFGILHKVWYAKTSGVMLYGALVTRLYGLDSDYCSDDAWAEFLYFERKYPRTGEYLTRWELLSMIGDSQLSSGWKIMAQYALDTAVPVWCDVWHTNVTVDRAGNLVPIDILFFAQMTKFNSIPHDWILVHSPHTQRKESKVQKVTIYVPSQTRNGTEFNSGPAVEDTLVFLASVFGGATIQPARGGWIDGAGNLVVESVTLVYSYTAGLTYEQRESVIDYCAKLRDDLDQSTVAVEILDIAGEFALI